MKKKLIIILLVCIALIAVLGAAMIPDSESSPWKKENTGDSVDAEPENAEHILESNDELVNTDILRVFYYEGIRYRASGDIQMELPEGYTSLGYTSTREADQEQNLYANFFGEVFQKYDSFYVKEDGAVSYVEFVRDPMQDVVNSTPLGDISFDIKGVSSLEIFDALSGKCVIVTDMLTIQEVLESVNGLTFALSDKQEEIPDSSYNLIFWNSMEREVVSFAVIDSEGKRIIYDTRYYDVQGEGSIDISMIARLVEEE